MKIIVRFLAIAVPVVVIMMWSSLLSGKTFHRFEGVKGPQVDSELTPIKPTQFEAYAEGETSRLALLVTTEDSNWLGLAHGLKTIGIPFIVTTDYARAVQHDVVLVYPIISGRTLSTDALKALADHPRQGGTLIATGVLGGGLNPVFGFTDVEESRSHSRVNFNTDYDVVSDFAALQQDKIKIGSDTNPDVNPGTNVYSGLLNPPLATYEDGSAAITYRAHGEGQAIAIGLDLGQIFLKGYSFREVDIADSYVNHYRPTLDALLRMLLHVYTSGEPNAVTLGTVPDGKSLTVLLSHDVDYTVSIQNAVKYAKFEAEQEISATYFIQTKYMRDFNDDIFFDDAGAANIERLKRLGAEIASHSVSHSLQFDSFPIGTGGETYPSYRPFVVTEGKTKDASLMGELRVSKFLLEQFSGGQAVTAFRPGYLRNPYALPQTLQWSGYRYSSTTTANKSLTHFPFRLNADRGYDSQSDIYEFPVTIEDEKLPRMGDRLAEAQAIADRLSEYGGLFVVLNHPDILGHKFEFEKGIVAHVKPYAWFGTMSGFGDWWRARDQVEIDVVSGDEGTRVRVSAPLPIKGLTLQIPPHQKLAAPDENIVQTGEHLLIRQLDGEIEIILVGS